MTATQTSIQYARTAAKAAFDKVATSVVALDVSARLALTDVFVIVSAETDRQVRAIVDAVDEELSKIGVERKRREGLEDVAHWVLVDYGDVVLHVFQDEDREYYALDKLWGDCPEIEVADLDPDNAATVAEER